MKAILIILILLMSSCTEYIIQIEDRPNIELSTVKDQLKPDLNTFKYWKDRSVSPGQEILSIHCRICDSKQVPDSVQVKDLSYEFNLCNTKLTARWNDITKLLDVSEIMCDDNLEQLQIREYHDSLRLVNYKHKEFSDMVFNSIEFIESY